MQYAQHSTDSIGISVIDVDMNVVRKYGNVSNFPSEDDEDAQSGYEGSEREDSIIIHTGSEMSDDTEDEIKQFLPNEIDQGIVIKEDEVVSNDLNVEETKEIQEENTVNPQKIEKRKSLKEEDVKIQNTESEDNIIPNKQKKLKKENEKTSAEKIQIEQSEVEGIRKKETKKIQSPKKQKKQQSKKDQNLQTETAFGYQSQARSLNMMRKRYVAKIKNILMAAPFDPNQSLLAFKKEIMSKIPNHAKLKKQKNLSKRIKFIKLKTPTFPMLIDVCCCVLSLFCIFSNSVYLSVIQGISSVKLRRGKILLCFIQNRMMKKGKMYTLWISLMIDCAILPIQVHA